MDTPNLPPSSRLRFRAVLDIVATAAMIAAAAVMIWTSLVRSSRPPGSGRPPIPVPTDPISLEGVPILGDPNARVVMIEFSDFECPFCGRFSKEVLPQIKARYVESGQLRLAFRHLPLERIHSRARQAAEAAECAARQGLFWPYRELLFANPSALHQNDLLDHGARAGLDRPSFVACIDGEAAARVRQDIELAKELSLTSTPTFFLGLDDRDEKVRIHEVISGAREFPVFAMSLERLIDGKP